MEHWFRPTGTPVLIAKCERVAQLAALPAQRPSVASEPMTDTSATELHKRV